jgi:hypothetical protein
MRLTLRTMLAYLDEILEPADAQMLAGKIEESEFASGLVHRIRGATRRLRLGAPRLEGKGMGLDPNTVAEYLDNTLPSDRVPDLEKVCLESDVHLAEVAACHQILTLVLGEPAIVPPGVRDRVYRIGTMLLQTSEGDGAGDGRRSVRADGAHRADSTDESHRSGSSSSDNSHGANRGKSNPTAAESKVSRATPQVPDYLKAGRRSRILPLAISVVLAFVLVGVTLLALGPLDQTHPLLGSLFAPKRQQVADGTGQNQGAGPNDLTANAPDNDAAAGSKSSSNGKRLFPGTSSRENDSDNQSADEGSTYRAADDGVDKDARTGAEAGLEYVDDNLPETADLRRDGSGGGDAALAPAGLATGASLETDGADAAGALNREPDPVTLPAPTPADETAARGAAAPASGGVAEGPRIDAPRIDVGRYSSDFQVLARAGVGGEWRRLETHAPLISGDRLLAPPTFRPQLVLTSGFQLTVPGPTLLQLDRPDDGAMSRLALAYGRTVLVPTLGRAGTSIELVLGDRRGIATFVDADSAVAVEVQLFREPGSDPLAARSVPIVQLLARSGQVEWREGPDTTIIEADRALRFVGDQPAVEEVPSELPSWLEPRDYGIERLAAQTLEPLLDVERPLVVSLREQTKHRQVEVRSLAVRCLSYLGIHEPVVEVFNDELYKSFWNAHYDSVQDALARGPESSAQVRTALETLRRGDAEELFRILQGYSPPQLAEGGAEELVERLDSQSLDFRVLSYLTLWRTTGFTLSYRPEVPEARRRTSAQRWRDRLSAGLIVYKESPEPADSSTTPKPVEDEPAP